MALAPSQSQQVQDGDQAFYRVNTFLPPHELAAGEVADAVNCRFEDGRTWPRFGVQAEAWGAIGGDLLATISFPTGAVGITYVEVPGFTVGREYIFTTTTDKHLGTGIFGNNILPGVPFTATQTSYYLNGGVSSDSAPGASIVPNLTVCGFARFSDPQGFDVTLLATDEWRTSDGGRGKMYRLLPGNAPVEVPMNGHDIWGTVRIIPAYNGVALLRQGNERHYFSASAVGTNQITLNAAQNWVNGDKVIYNIVGSSSITGTKPPNPGAGYYVKVLSGNKVELYTDSALTTKMTFNVAVGKFYLERAADFPGFYGNVAPPLLARPTAAGNTWLDVGFKSVPTTISVTGSASATGILNVPQHGFLPGDAVVLTGVRTTAGALISDTVYASPVSPDALKLYSTAIQATAATATGLIPIYSDGETGTIAKNGATGQPMPGGREGLYFQSRLLVVNNADTLMISDPLDPLHFSPFVAAVTANLGSSDPITALWPYGPDSVLVLRTNRVDLLDHLSGGPDAWTLTSLTKEYGCIAPLSLAQTGADVWFLSRKGVASITQTKEGAIQGVAEPVSKALKRYIEQIDWRYASGACAEYWNNRYFLAVPLKEQTGTVRNNGVLVHNFLNGGWEGKWEGTNLLPIAFARQSVFGEERLTFTDPTGIVRWFDDGFTDGNNAISTELLTRRYIGGNTSRKLWLTADLVVDSYAPTYSITAVFPGVNETQTLVSGGTFDPTAYLKYNQTAYDPNAATTDTFSAPYRADYQITAAELLAGAPDTHQNRPLSLRMRMTEWGVQLRIENTTGSLRVQSVNVGGNQKSFTSTDAI